MKKQTFLVLRRCLPLGLSLAFGVVACGGSDGDGNKSSSGGSGGSATNASGGTSTAGTSASTAGGTSKAGSSGSAGSASQSGGGLDTGLPGDKPLSSLTDDELAALCDKFDDFYSTGKVADALQDFNCGFAGLFAAAFSGADSDAAVRAACKATYDECAAAPSETTSTCNEPSGTCTATVAELEACANDSGKALEQVASAFPSCAELTLTDLMGMGDDTEMLENPVSCAILETKCPGGPKPPLAM